MESLTQIASEHSLKVKRSRFNPVFTPLGAIAGGLYALSVPLVTLKLPISYIPEALTGINNFIYHAFKPMFSSTPKEYAIKATGALVLGTAIGAAIDFLRSRR